MKKLNVKSDFVDKKLQEVRVLAEQILKEMKGVQDFSSRVEEVLSKYDDIRNVSDSLSNLIELIEEGVKKVKNKMDRVKKLKKK